MVGGVAKGRAGHGVIRVSPEMKGRRVVQDPAAKPSFPIFNTRQEPVNQGLKDNVFIRHRGVTPQ